MILLKSDETIALSTQILTEEIFLLLALLCLDSRPRETRLSDNPKPRALQATF